MVLCIIFKKKMYSKKTKFKIMERVDEVRLSQPKFLKKIFIKLILEPTKRLFVKYLKSKILLTSDIF